MITMYILGVILVMFAVYLGMADVRTDGLLYRIIKSSKVPQNNLAGILFVVGTISFLIGAIIS